MRRARLAKRSAPSSAASSLTRYLVDTTGLKRWAERAVAGDRNTRASSADATRLSKEVTGTPTEQIMAVPQASQGEQSNPFGDWDLEAQFLTKYQQTLDALANSLTVPSITISKSIEPRQTLWSLAVDDLGPGATVGLQPSMRYMAISSGTCLRTVRRPSSKAWNFCQKPQSKLVSGSLSAQWLKKASLWWIPQAMRLGAPVPRSVERQLNCLGKILL